MEDVELLVGIFYEWSDRFKEEQKGEEGELSAVGGEDTKRAATNRGETELQADMEEADE